jgi:hypothetical protein
MEGGGTFADFDRLCKLEKRGDEIKKKSFPLNLLSQSQPNLPEMILGWPPSKIVSGDPDFQFQRRRFKCDLLSKYA